MSCVRSRPQADTTAIAEVLHKHLLETDIALDMLVEAVQNLSDDDTSVIFPKQIEEGVKESLIEALFDISTHLEDGVRKARRIYTASTSKRVLN